MARLTPVSYRDFMRRLRKLGFEGPHSGGRHPFVIRRGRAYHVPNPHHGDISISLLRRVLRQLDVTLADWESAA